MKKKLKEVVYYLPNNMFVANYRNHISSEEMDELFSVYIGVESGKGFLVRYPYELEAPDCLVPFWQLCQNADEALVNSGLYYNEYYDYIYQDALYYVTFRIASLSQRIFLFGKA